MLISLPTIATVVIVLGLVVVVGAPYLERALLYHPDTARRAPAVYGLDQFTETIIDSADGQAQLVIWHRPARDGAKTVLYFHGNAGHLGNRAERLASFAGAGLGVAIMAYRGFSGSTGTPSEAHNVADAETVLNWLQARGTGLDRIVVYGESLGSGIAVQLAARHTGIAGLVLDAPYTAIVDVGAQAYPFLPVRLMMRDRYETRRYIARTTCPILIVHGDQDEIIPVDMGRELARMAGPRAEFRVINGAGHADHHLRGSREITLRWIAGLSEN